MYTFAIDKEKHINTQKKIDYEIEEFERKLDYIGNECSKRQKIKANLSDDWVIKLRQRLQKKVSKLKV